MVLNLDPFLSPIHTRFDLHPFTSFQPLPLFTILPQSVLWSFEYATRPTTFIFRPTFFTLFFLSGFEEPRTQTDPCTDTLSCWQTLRAQPEGFLGPTLERVAECIHEVKPTTERLHYKWPRNLKPFVRDTEVALSCHEVLDFGGRQSRIWKQRAAIEGEYRGGRIRTLSYTPTPVRIYRLNQEASFLNPFRIYARFRFLNIVKFAPHNVPQYFPMAIDTTCCRFTVKTSRR